MKTYQARMNQRIAALLMGGGLFFAGGYVSAAPGQDAGVVIVTRFKDSGSSVIWNVTLPKAMSGHIQDQAWLVVDGQSEGIGGYDIPPADFPRAGHGPLRLSAGISSDLDGQVKDILKAQGLPGKPDVTVYHFSYGVNLPGQCQGPKTLHFRHSANALIYQHGFFPATTHYRIGDRITLLDAVALDSAALGPASFVPGDRQNRVKSGLPKDLAHHILIQVQFLPVGADGKLITKLASR